MTNEQDRSDKTDPVDPQDTAAAVESDNANDAVVDTPEILFADFNLSPAIGRAIDEIGYVTPTPIQAQAIPVVLQGLDVMGAAQTGTGKTAGFALPILQRLMRHANTSASPARHPVRALILAPTRELADQIFENVAAYAKHTGLRATAVFGGVDIRPQMTKLRNGAEVLIATPGRLLDHVGQKNVNLSQVEVLVLDEADRMLDMGFLPDIQRIIDQLPKNRQNLMFSATFSKDIRKLAKTFLNNPISIETARRNAAAENVEQTVYLVSGDDAKRDAVAHLIRQRELSQVIVFSNTKIGASRLARELEKEGLNASAIHGDKTQQERLATLDGFKKGEIKILVATDVAARGLDIAELPAVINFDLPYTPEDYVHRIGRTGRAGASGMALSLMVARDEKLRAEIAKLIKRDLTPEVLEIAGSRRQSARPERSASRGRDRSAPSSRGRDAGRSPARRSAPINKLAGSSTDSFFYKPYEEIDPAPSEQPTEQNSANRDKRSSLGGMSPTGRSRAPRRQQVPALLGGLKKAS